MLTTRNQVEAYCAKLGIELEVELARGTDTSHVHAYVPRGYRFRDLDIHNITLWDSYEAPDWRTIGKEIENETPLTKCDDPRCDYCIEECV